MKIAYKEARETHYWLRLLHDSKLMDTPAFTSIAADCEELLKLLGSITKTMRNKL
jgi:four helix bundle protein